MLRLGTCRVGSSQGCFKMPYWEEVHLKRRVFRKLFNLLHRHKMLKRAQILGIFSISLKIAAFGVREPSNSVSKINCFISLNRRFPPSAFRSKTFFANRELRTTFAPTRIAFTKYGREFARPSLLPNRNLARPFYRAPLCRWAVRRASAIHLVQAQFRACALYTNPFVGVFARAKPANFPGGKAIPSF